MSPIWLQPWQVSSAAQTKHARDTQAVSPFPCKAQGTWMQHSPCWPCQPQQHPLGGSLCLLSMRLSAVPGPQRHRQLWHLECEAKDAVSVCETGSLILPSPYLPRLSTHLIFLDSSLSLPFSPPCYFFLLNPSFVPPVNRLGVAGAVNELTLAFHGVTDAVLWLLLLLPGSSPQNDPNSSFKHL